MSDKPTRFETFQRRAEHLLQSPGRVQTLASTALTKLSGSGTEKLKEIKDQVLLFVALVRAWLSGDYREVSQGSIVAVVAALLYFVVPLDVIPDFLFGWGFIDDIAVIGYVFGQLKEELDAFKTWQDGQYEEKV